MLKYLFLVLITFNVISLKAAKVDTVTVFSQANQQKISFAVVLPDVYHEEPLPVMYLLHGFSDKFDGWLKLPPDKMLVHKMADTYKMIIVCPDGGYGSWYLNSPIKKDSQYESFIIKELIPYVDKNYKTLAKRESRVIVGLSMGGHGALTLAAKNPELFVGAGSIAGVMDLIDGAINQPKGQIHDWFIKVLGDSRQFPEHYTANSAYFMTDKLKLANLKLIIDVGTGDFLFKQNQAMHKKLLEQNIPHDYTERPGEHNWKYFANSLEYHLLFFDRIIKR
jgi:S-formylglutathione hydrolase FrmB